MFSRLTRPVIDGWRACRRCPVRAPRCSCPNAIGSLWRFGRSGTNRRRSGCSMKVTGAVMALMLAAVLTCWCDGAQAYRPFDGTDAAVTDIGDVEIELGPVEYLREAAERTLFAPDLRLN